MGKGTQESCAADGWIMVMGGRAYRSVLSDLTAVGEVVH